MEASLADIKEAWREVSRSAALSRKPVGPILGGLYYAFKSERLMQRAMVPLSEYVVSDRLSDSSTVRDSTANAADVEAWLWEAVLRSVHSSGDLLGQVINQVALEKPLSVDSCVPSSVLDKLDSEAQKRARPELAQLARRFRAYRESDEFLYLEAFVNVCKHQSFVQRAHQEHVSLSGDRTTRVILQPFEHKGREFPHMATEDLQALTAGLRTQVVTILREAARCAWKDG